MPAFKEDLDRLRDAVLFVDRVHIRAGSHHFRDSRILKGDDAVYHLALVLFKRSRRAALAHDVIYLLPRDKGAVGDEIHAYKLADQFKNDLQKGHHRRQYKIEGAQKGEAD